MSDDKVIDFPMAARVDISLDELFKLVKEQEFDHKQVIVLVMTKDGQRHDFYSNTEFSNNIFMLEDAKFNLLQAANSDDDFEE